ncbi:DUF3373 family protein [Sulfurospirillum sp. 1307]
MKKIIAPMLIGATLATAAMAGDDSLKAEIEALKAQMAELKEAQSKINIDALKSQLSEVKAHTGGDNIKWSVDFRSAYDILNSKTTSGKAVTGFDFTSGNPATATLQKSDVKGKTYKNGIWTNKLILGMAAQPVDNLVFKGSLGFYKAFGQSSMWFDGTTDSTAMFQNFDWYANQKPQGDNVIRLREAYFLYFGQMGDIPYTASFGRRPSVDGFMTNLREDNEHPASPVGHNINMEFDGASFKFDFEKITDIPGLYFKICLGRGFSDITGSYSMNSMGGFNPSYLSGSANPDMDLAGLLIQAYDDGQYKVMANVFQGWNMMGLGGIKLTVNDNGTGIYSVTPDYTNMKFQDVGDMQGASLSLQVNGIGDEINDFLDDTVFFASVAMSKTQPNNKVANDVDISDLMSDFGVTSLSQLNTMLGSAPADMQAMFSDLMKQGAGMLGSQDDETGYSYYVGVQIPGFFDSDRIGLEYNHGSKYWRSYTYGEDTLVGSKLATRGDAYEVYYNLPLIARNLTAQVRYTYIDYDYTGSDTFFGQTGTPTDVDTTPGAVKSASDLRLSLRYRY